MSPCPVRVSVNIKQISFVSGCFSLSLWVHVCMRLWLSHSLDCVLPVTPVSLIQLLHVQSELAQAEILNSVFVVRSAAQRWHTLRRCWEKGEGRKGKDGVRIMKESGLNVSWIAAQCIIQCRANNFFQLLKSVMQRALAEGNTQESVCDCCHLLWINANWSISPSVEDDSLLTQCKLYHCRTRPPKPQTDRWETDETNWTPTFPVNSWWTWGRALQMLRGTLWHINRRTVWQMM